MAHGDTIDVLHDGTVDRVRVWGIDAPEKKQPFGARAKEFVGGLVFARSVTVRVRGTDRYRRIIAEVLLLDGRDLGQEIVRDALAWWYRAYTPNDRTLADLEHEARAARRGLWIEPGPVPPWEGRKPFLKVSQ